MKTRFVGVCQILALTLVVCSLSAFVVAASNDKVTARYVVIPPKPAAPGSPLPQSTLQTWNGSFTSNNQNYNYVMVGQNPTTGQGTIVTTYIIPVKIILSTGEVFDPSSGGAFNPVARTMLSPIFDGSTYLHPGRREPSNSRSASIDWHTRQVGQSLSPQDLLRF